MEVKISQVHPCGDNIVNLKLGKVLTIKGRLLPGVTCLHRNVTPYCILLQAHTGIWSALNT
jgi:hypothetical protein